MQATSGNDGNDAIKAKVLACKKEERAAVRSAAAHMLSQLRTMHAVPAVPAVPAAEPTTEPTSELQVSHAANHRNVAARKNEAPKSVQVPPRITDRGGKFGGTYLVQVLQPNGQRVATMSYWFYVLVDACVPHLHCVYLTHPQSLFVLQKGGHVDLSKLEVCHVYHNLPVFLHQTAILPARLEVGNACAQCLCIQGVGKLRVCGGCKKHHVRIHYCSAACQQQHWSVHKDVCLSCLP